MAGSPATETYNAAGNNDSSRKTVELAGRATPTTRDHKSGAADLTNSLIRKDGKKRNDLLDYQTFLASGPPTTSSPAQTARRGALAPAFSRWLIGLPPEWDACAPTAMPSSRRLRRSS
jgi:hypothetical protein